MIGVNATMNRFDFLFRLMLAERLLQRTDNLSRTLQTPSLTASEGQQVADMTCKTLIRIITNEAFDLFWKKVQILQREIVWMNLVYHKRGRPLVILEVGSGEAFCPSTPKQFYSQHYFECLNFVVNAVKDRFD